MPDSELFKGTEYLSKSHRVNRGIGERPVYTLDALRRDNPPQNCLCQKISEDRYRSGGWTPSVAPTPAPGVLNYSHAVENDRETLVLFRNTVREMGYDELLINPVKTAFV
jgi:hypothetical protein